MPPFLKKIVALLVRAAVVWAAGYLAAKTGVQLTEDQIGQLIAYLAPVAAVLVWSFLEKRKDQLKLLTALSTTQRMSEKAVEAIVKDPALPNPSLLTPKSQVP